MLRAPPTGGVDVGHRDDVARRFGAGHRVGDLPRTGRRRASRRRRCRACVVAGGGAARRRRRRWGRRRCGVTVTVCVSVAVGGGGRSWWWWRRRRRLVVVISSCIGGVGRDGGRGVRGWQACWCRCARTAATPKPRARWRPRWRRRRPPTASAERRVVLVLGWLVVVVVVVEPEIGRHIGAADEVLGLRSRIGPRIGVGLAGLVGRQFGGVVGGFELVIGTEFAAGFGGVRGSLPESGWWRARHGIGFLRFPSRGIRPAHVCLPCPTASPARRPRSHIVARALGRFSFAWAKPYRTERGKEVFANRPPINVIPDCDL